MKLRIGVVGLGADWDNRYKPAFRALADRFEIKAVCEPVALRAETAVRDFGACPVDGFRSLAGRPDIDALFVLSRGWYGALPVMAACDAGKSVYCTEGLDQDLGKAAEIKAQLERAGVAFLAEFPRRYAPATARLKELIATQLGAPRLLFCHTRVKQKKQLNNGVAVAPPRSPVSHLIELADWCRYVVGHDPTSVMGVAHGPAHADFDGDYQMMSLEFVDPNDSANDDSANDDSAKVVTAQVSCGQYMPSDWPEALTFRPPPEFQVTCENGIAFVDLPSTLIWFDKAGRHMESLESERPVGELMLLQFYRCVTSLLHNPSGVEDAYRALAIVDAARESYRQGKRIPLGP